ncbi:efflux RND transporter periplasmic adaptor subunit [Billgrantia tianxiuensis]|nr:efflux RND transporter periplasmic adaptor subunit [Halomonas tianxiuensis]
MGRVARGSLAVSLMLGIILLSGCDAAPAQIETGETVLPSVRSETVRLSQAETRYRFPGTVRASERATLAFLHHGVLRERHVARGQRVERGEPLATLHNPAMAPALVAAEARISELDARLRRMERDVERARVLRERNLSAEEELDRLRSEREATVQAREQALAQRDEARAQLDELTLRAPFAGVVTDLEAEPGDFLAAGQPVLGLVGLTGREVEIRVPAALPHGWRWARRRAWWQRWGRGASPAGHRHRPGGRGHGAGHLGDRCRPRPGAGRAGQGAAVAGCAAPASGAVGGGGRPRRVRPARADAER